MRSRGTFENHTRFKTRMVKVYTCFQTKTAQKPYPWGNTYQYTGVSIVGSQNYNSRLGSQFVGCVSWTHCWVLLGAVVSTVTTEQHSQVKDDPRSCERNLFNCVKKPENFQDFGEVWTRDLAIPVWCSNQLSYEAIDVGSRSVVGSYVPVKEMNVNDVYEINHIWIADMIYFVYIIHTEQHVQTFPTCWANDGRY